MSAGGDTISKAIGTPIEFGHPADVVFGAKELSRRQQNILNELPGCGSKAIFRKKDVSMLDLSALTAKTGDEFAMFSRKREQLVMRGDKNSVPIGPVEAIVLRDEGYRWSGHTHPGYGGASLIVSDGDRLVLEAFGQAKSALYNSAGKYCYVERGKQQ